MKITKIDLIPISLPRPAPSTRQNNVVLIKMYTDEGIVGTADGGEYPGGSGQELVMAIVKSWEPILIGADPFDKTKSFQSLGVP